MRKYTLKQRIKFAFQFKFFPKKLFGISLPTIPDDRDIDMHNIWLDIKQNNKRKSAKFTPVI